VDCGAQQHHDKGVPAEAVLDLRTKQQQHDSECDSLGWMRRTSGRVCRRAAASCVPRRPGSQEGHHVTGLSQVAHESHHVATYN
jgi:hypothetical protein